MTTLEQVEREWRRFDDRPTPFTSAATHAAYLRRAIRPGDRVLDAGFGPGRFAIELDLGAEPGAIETGRHILAVVRRC